jgi:hypothetical protein
MMFSPLWKGTAKQYVLASLGVETMGPWILYYFKPGFDTVCTLSFIASRHPHGTDVKARRRLCSV